MAGLTTEDYFNYISENVPSRAVERAYVILDREGPDAGTHLRHDARHPLGTQLSRGVTKNHAPKLEIAGLLNGGAAKVLYHD